MSKARCLLLFVIACMLMLLPVYTANCQNYTEYNVTIRADGSAAWTIIQVSDISAPIDTWEGFQQKVLRLVDAAAATTHRDMTVDSDSLQIDTTISSTSKTTEYTFTWQNFSTTQNEEITFGDVFGASNFFGQLYGDASIQMTYPSTFTIKHVSPTPSERDDQRQTLDWRRTQDFVNGEPNIVLAVGNPAENSNIVDWQLLLVIGAVSATAVGLIAGFLLFRRRTKPQPEESATIPRAPHIENDEDKIINILKASGGTTRQSDITEQSKFSKAKTSQLLAALEQKGVVTRYKKGRDKIVTFNNNKQGS
jgi:uncharacterized membrane protein